MLWTVILECKFFILKNEKKKLKPFKGCKKLDHYLCLWLSLKLTWTVMTNEETFIFHIMIGHGRLVLSLEINK